MICLNLMLEPTCPNFWHEKGNTCFLLGLSLIEIIKQMIILTIQVILYDGDKNSKER